MDPEWKDLAEFINKQAKNDRDVIDHWIKLASALLGFVLLFGVGVMAFLGWKTTDDARVLAITTAREVAKARVEEVLKQPELQTLVRETARDLYDKGTFRNEIEAKVHDLISAEIATPESRKIIGDTIRGELHIRVAARVLIRAQKRAVTQSLRSRPGGHVNVSGPTGERRNYANHLYSAIKASPSWRDHVSMAPAQGSWAALTPRGDETEEALGGLSGIAIVVNDKGHPPDSAHQLEAAQNSARLADIVQISTCGCADPPKVSDVWLSVLEKTY